MTLSKLSSDLRREVLATMVHKWGDHSPAAALEACGPDALVWFCLTCCECGQRLVENFVPLVVRVADTEEFCRVASGLHALHRIDSHGVQIPEQDGAEVTVVAVRRSIAEYLTPRGAK